MNRLMAIVILGILFTTTSFAIQIKNVKDNQSVSAKISVKELSRIFVEGDRIQAIRGINGAYEIIKDEKQGMVFIKPSPFYYNKPFNVFLTTELGHTYNLLLIPVNIPAQNIQITPLSPAKKLASRWELNSPYIDKLIQLMNDMINDGKPEGYAVYSINSKPIRYPQYTIEPVKIYKGNYLYGEISLIKNCTKNTIKISPYNFYQKNTRAIALQNETLISGGSTYLYKVKDHG